MKWLRTFACGCLLLGVGTCNINVFDRVQPQAPVYDVVYIDDHYYDNHYSDDYYYEEVVYIDW